ncbi:helix-turn-helix domain-containing GNAT family N-acetyltransferase [Reyranella aquatilis]|uniref:Helix-turn-helix domain-containing GNAT family N-acetyltransferase n=1 Tax=Reyranella aquatilis TaxID=2035356 RepID=A0ABS8KNA1_9HYPH|nr:helix-turn-helix domain-containing GNAT family N-acetyltransferase [Reyranella aquatilis]MCC8427552.1 helix-turn-helix domain-containing GNAT family N-acetyltransferase [Reyranella aquatilis]
MAASSLASRIEAVRRFSRFYTRRIGVLEETLLHSPFTLPEGRLVYEIANRDRPTAQELCRDLGLDPGYVSRLLQGLEKRGCVARKRSAADKRQTELTLTPKGQKLWGAMNERSRQDIADLLAELPADRQDRLVKALGTVEKLLDEPPEKRVPFTLRPHQPGDLGWIIRRQTQLYASEYGWDGTFEAMLAEISAKFIRKFDPKSDNCWIAERNGEIAGSVFLVRAGKTTGQLRMLYVEPSARGLGIGQSLVAACIEDARAKGYRKLMLWTNDILVSARKIYIAAGFRLIREEKHESFGKKLVGQFWSLDL